MLGRASLFIEALALHCLSCISGAGAQSDDSRLSPSTTVALANRSMTTASRKTQRREKGSKIKQQKQTRTTAVKSGDPAQRPFTIHNAVGRTCVQSCLTKKACRIHFEALAAEGPSYVPRVCRVPLSRWYGNAKLSPWSHYCKAVSNYSVVQAVISRIHARLDEPGTI